MKETVYKDIERIIPHRCPMIMIDEYQKIDENTARACKQFSPGNYGCEKGWVMESILIETIAQTVAAHFGYKALKENSNDAGPGMLTSVDEFEVHQMVKDTSKIDVHVVKTDKIGPFTLIDGKIRVKDKLEANGRIKVFNPGDKAGT